MATWKPKAALAILLTLGVFGSGLHWLAVGSEQQPANASTKKAETPNKVRPPAASVNEDNEAQKTIEAAAQKEEQAKRLRRDRLEQLVKQLEVAEAVAQKAEKELSDEIFQLRSMLVELEEKLKDTQDNKLQSLRTLIEENRKKSVLAMEAYQAIANQRMTEKHPTMVELKGKRDRAMQAADEAEREYLKEKETLTKTRIKLRREIARAEDSLTRMEQKRADLRTETATERHFLTDRIRRLKFDTEASPERPTPTEEKLDALRRELGELSREIRRLRDGKK